jgi:hypothetical protein
VAARAVVQTGWFWSVQKETMKLGCVGSSKRRFHLFGFHLFGFHLFGFHLFGFHLIGFQSSQFSIVLRIFLIHTRF